MFGFRVVDQSTNVSARFGVSIEFLPTGQWLDVHFGRRSWVLTRYTANRHTGPEDNADVVRAFFGGAERRRRKAEFHSGWTRRISAPRMLSREEIMRRNREAIASGVVKPLPLTVYDMGESRRPR
jgi:hypothetical protein